MKLRNVLIVVKDIEQSKKFYQELFGLQVILDQDANVILTEGLVLQERSIWEASIGKCVAEKNHAIELYFEERDLESFVEKLEAYDSEIQYVTPLTTYEWGKSVVRFYDLDGNLIEVGTPM